MRSIVDMHVRPASLDDLPVVSSILMEAAAWLRDRGTPMWRDDELGPDRLSADVRAGSFFLAVAGDEAVGTIKFQLADREFWPDVPDGDSVYVHRLAVRRRVAGGAVSSALPAWALDRGSSLGRLHARLDCEASRPRLRAIYERAGFRFHSNRQVGPYLVARYEYRLPPAGSVWLRDVTIRDLPVLFNHQRDPEANRSAAFTAERPDDRDAFNTRWRRLFSDETVTARAVVRDGEVVGSISSFVAPGPVRRRSVYGSAGSTGARASRLRPSSSCFVR